MAVRNWIDVDTLARVSHHVSANLAILAGLVVLGVAIQYSGLPDPMRKAIHGAEYFVAAVQIAVLLYKLLVETIRDAREFKRGPHAIFYA